MRSLQPEPDSPRRVGIIARVSTRRQAETGYNLEEQVNEGTKWAHAHGGEVVETYVDPVSGKFVFDREGIGRLLADAEAGKLDAAYAWKVDRVGRAVEIVLLEERLRNLGVQLVIADIDLDTSTATGRAMLGNLAVFAQLERELNSERVKLALEARARKGKSHSSRYTPFAFSRGDDGILVPIEAEAAVVRQIAAEVIEGLTMRAVARRLNAEGWRTRARKEWTTSSLSQLLRNPLLAGKVQTTAGEIVEGLHEGVLDGETFDRLQEALARNPTPKRGRPPSVQFLLATGPRLICGHCGTPMRARSGKSRKTPVYACGRRLDLGPDACDMPPVPRDLVDPFVLEHLEQLGLDREKSREAAQEALRGRFDGLRGLREFAEREAMRAEDQLVRQRQRWRDGELTTAEWREERDHLEAEREAALREAAQRQADEHELREEVARLDAADLLESYLREIRETVAGRGSEQDLEPVRAALGRVFAEFIYDPQPGGPGLDEEFWKQGEMYGRTVTFLADPHQPTYSYAFRRRAFMIGVQNDPDGLGVRRFTHTSSTPNGPLVIMGVTQPDFERTVLVVPSNKCDFTSTKTELSDTLAFALQQSLLIPVPAGSEIDEPQPKLGRLRPVPAAQD